MDTGVTRDPEQSNQRASHGLANNTSPPVLFHPHGGLRGAWHVATLVCVLCDSIVIPLLLIDPPITSTLNLLTWCSRLFWTIDMFASASTGYLEYDGCVEMRGRRVIQRYAKTWFAFDATISSLDWIDLGLSLNAENSKNVGIMGRAMKFLLMARLLRLVRIQKVMATMSERIRSEMLVLLRVS